MQDAVKKLFLLLAVIGANFPVLAQNGALLGFEPSMKSRVCGLVLLSEGRAKIRSNTMERGFADLISAFALLQDGRKLSDKDSAREASNKILTGSTDAKATSIAQCRQWFEERKANSDFSQTEADQWDWVRQAQITIQSEKK